ncbi:MAG: J domain-containing protein [Syntrophobacterales bacterium]|jgi:hypothetical protein
MDLGQYPGDYIEYFGGNAFYFKEELEETLQDKGVTYSTDDLEEIFKPFLDPDIRRIIENFERPKSRLKQWSTCSDKEILKHQRGLHSFDKRRLHYLRCGQVNIGNLDRLPLKFFSVLFEKSRDEIEQVFGEKEQILRPDEIRRYLYAALRLQTHFSHLLTRHQPEILDPLKLDQHFLEEICILNSDKTFFRGVESTDPASLHPYLAKYVILYFDHAFHPELAWDEYMQEFRWRHQFYRRTSSTAGATLPEEEACQCLGITQEELRKMDLQQLTSHFRKLAKKAHPDVGGDEKTFVKIKEAYESLATTKC